MNPLDAWRGELRRLIPRGFVRRDQGDELLVSDYPRWDRAEEITAALVRAGFTVRPENELAYLDGSLRKYRALTAALVLETPRMTDENLFLYALGDRLLRYGGEVTEENLPLVRLTLKAVDGGDPNALARLLSPACAEAQRKHIGLPKAAGMMIMMVLSSKL